jgi:hypothetical protein
MMQRCESLQQLRRQSEQSFLALFYSSGLLKQRLAKKISTMETYYTGHLPNVYSQRISKEEHMLGNNEICKRGA